MDTISAILLGALNVPVSLLFCGFVRKVFFRDRQVGNEAPGLFFA